MKRLTLVDLYGVRNAAEYREAQRQFLKKHRRGATPTVSPLKKAAALEADGALRIRCTCGEYPAVDPESRVSCCFNCGLIYEDVSTPGEET